MIMIKHYRTLGAATLVALAGTLTGCGSTSTTTTTTQPRQSAAATNPLAKAVPAAIKKTGTLVFGSDMTYPPFEFLSPNKTPQGFDIDLATAIASALGLKAQFVQNGFDALPTSLASGRFNAVISAMTDDPTRRKAIDFVDYAQVQGGVMVRTNDTSAPTSFTDLCGYTVAVQRGSDQVRQAQQQRATCTRNGKKALTINVYPGAPEQALALKSGRVDAALYDTVTGGYTAKKSDGAFKMGTPYGTPVIDGIGVAKTNPGLRNAIRTALQQLMNSGTYKTLLTKWGMNQAAIPKATINAGGEGTTGS